MFKALELENFKAFGNRTRIEFAPITLIFGENSAGKSSILQSLNLLKQTRESREYDVLLLPRSESGFVDLGSFQELLFDHDLSRQLSIRVDILVRQRRLFGSRLFSDVSETEECTIGFEMRFSRQPNDNEVCLVDLSLFLRDQSKPAFRFEAAPLQPDELSQIRPYHIPWRSRRPLRRQELRAARCTEVAHDTELWADLFDRCKPRSTEVAASIRALRDDLIGRKDRSQPSLFEEENLKRSALKQAEEFYDSDFTLGQFADRMRQAALGTIIALDGFLPLPARIAHESPYAEFAATRYMRGPGLDFSNFDAGSLMVDSGRAVEDALEALFPMGPFRRPPERWYIFTGTSPRDVGYKGELLPDLLFRRPALLQETNEWLDRLEMGYHITVRPVGAAWSDLFELRLVDTRRAKNVEVALSDVGFGISQLLPFVVQSLAAERQVISIEQPEVHVHPRLQADLGDLLIAGIQRPRRHRFIVETHSEHLILRLLRRIRETADGELPEGHPGLKAEDVSIIYLERGDSGSKVHHLRIDSTGEFVDRWPRGFFEERAAELF